MESIVVSFCILLSNWFFFLGSDLLMDTGFCHLIGQISWLLIRKVLADGVSTAPLEI
jgi:hypothetical protein